MDMAASLDQVSAFCQSVVSYVLPRDLFGQAVTQESNLRLLMRNIDGFVRARRFESFSLERVMQGMQVSSALPKATMLLNCLGP